MKITTILTSISKPIIYALSDAWGSVVQYIYKHPRHSISFGNVFILGLIVLGSSSCVDEPVEKADLIVHNAQIITVDQDFSYANTMAVKDGSIIYIGDSKNIGRWRDSTTQVIDLEGKTLMPGFVEPHTHPIASTVLYNWIDVSGNKHKSAWQALRHLRREIRKVPEGEWVLAFGWDLLKLKGAPNLTKEYIDNNITSRHPVWIMTQPMHTHYFNSRALKKANISNDTPDPIGGGHYVRDKNNRLTGMTTESSTVIPMVTTLPPLSPAKAKTEISKMYSRYNAAGITSIGATGIIGIMPGINPIDICKDIADDDPVSLRLFYYDVGNGKVYDYNDGDHDETISKLGQKYWVDGSPYTGSMLLREPYLNSSLNKKLGIDKDSYGHSMHYTPIYESLFKSTLDSNYQLSVHVQGDSAVQIAINTLDSLRHSGYDLSTGRHRFEHLALVTEAQLSMMKSLDITPSFHINHIYYYGDSLASSIIGPERAARMMPLKDAAQRGHRLSLHNDSPMYRPDPLLAVRTAVTRLTQSGQLIGPEQAIDLRSAIEAITIDAAWQLHMDDKIGSLEVDKKADFVILNESPFDVPKKNIHLIKVVGTYVGGQKVL